MAAPLFIVGLTVFVAVFFGTPGMAGVIDLKHVPVHAQVPKHASVTSWGRIAFLNLRWLPDREYMALGRIMFRVKTNTRLNLTFSGGDLTHRTGSPAIKTAYRAYHMLNFRHSIPLGYFNRQRPGYEQVGNLFLDSFQPALSSERYFVKGWVKTSHEPFGIYGSTITLTVSDS